MSKNHTSKTRIVAAGVGVVAVAVPSLVALASPASAVSSVVPTISKLSTSAGSTGGTTNVLITGKNFHDASAVEFGAVAAASFLILNDTQIAAVAATGHAAGTFQLKVTNTAGASLDKATDDFTFVAPFTTTTDTAQKLNPLGGSTIIATSSVGWTDLAGFKAAKVTATVNGRAAQVAYASATTAKITAPVGTPSASAAAVLLYKHGIASTAAGTPAAKYAAVISKLSKTSGPLAGGGTLTVTGKGFGTSGAPATAWKFGLTNLSTTATPVVSAGNTASCTVVNDTTATCTIPAAPKDGGSVDPSNPAGALAGAVTVSFTPVGGVPYASLPAATYTYSDIS